MKPKTPTAAALIYPNCDAVYRTVCVGGIPKGVLLADLEGRGVRLNDYGRALFAHANFQVASTVAMISTIELTVAMLGYPLGETIEQIHGRVADLGLVLCPIELGPHLRLQCLDQPEGHAGYPPSSHRAPTGSIASASPALADDDLVPKGFYLRRIEGVLWLRGYCAGPELIWM